MLDNHHVSEECSDQRVVEQAKIAQACEVLGLPAPKSDSDVIVIEIRPFWDGSASLSPIRMTERRSRLSYVPLVTVQERSDSSTTICPAESR